MSNLQDQIEEMMAIQRALGAVALGSRLDSAGKANVVEMRRNFANALRRVSTAMEEDDQIRANPELAKEFRTRFSEMRSRIAIFQAKWPAVLLGSDDIGFEQAGRQLAACNREFTAWAHKALQTNA